jgi:uncharacterized protein YdhG (YjbR/CyaY superfamily)
MGDEKFSSIDAYNAAFPEDVQEKLETIRTVIRQVIPEAKEVISYNIPGFKMHGMVVYYAAFKKHLSLYPAPRGKEWEKDFEGYRTSGKGTIQFSLDKPLPLELIRKIVRYRAEEDLKKR